MKAFFIEFYESFVRKQLMVFDFKSNVFSTQSFLDPSLSQKMSTSTFEVLEAHFPISFDKSAVKLEYREFVTDDTLNTDDSDAIHFKYEITNGFTQT